MNRKEWQQFLEETYAVDVDTPWLRYPGHQVFRHSGSKKWMALIIDIPKSKLGLASDELLAVVNFKCDPLLIGSLLQEPGFFPAYHMNKESWITVALDGTVADEKIKMLADLSYDLTKGKPTKQAPKRPKK